MCFLDNETFVQEAYTHVVQMTTGSLIYTQVNNYTEDGIPLVYCYIAVGPQVIFV